jgi:hypothetical protein
MQNPERSGAGTPPSRLERQAFFLIFAQAAPSITSILAISMASSHHSLELARISLYFYPRMQRF